MTVRGQLASRLLRLLAEQVGHGDRGALLAEGAAGRRPDPARAAGHQRDARAHTDIEARYGLKSGMRFSANALTPSAASSEPSN